MIHFVEIDKNKVISMTLIMNNVLKGRYIAGPNNDDETFIKNYTKSKHIIKLTSFNNKFRGRFATIGDTYDPEKDCFVKNKRKK